MRWRRGQPHPVMSYLHPFRTRGLVFLNQPRLCVHGRSYTSYLVSYEVARHRLWCECSCSGVPGLAALARVIHDGQGPSGSIRTHTQRECSPPTSARRTHQPPGSLSRDGKSPQTSEPRTCWKLQRFTFRRTEPGPERPHWLRPLPVHSSILTTLSTCSHLHLSS